MISGTSWIGSSYEVVYMSAVILLHQVCDAFGYQKWTPQSQSDSCCQHCVMQHTTVFKQVLCPDVCCIADIVLQRPYVHGLAYSQLASVFVLALHVVCFVL